MEAWRTAQYRPYLCTVYTHFDVGRMAQRLRSKFNILKWKRPWVWGFSFLSCSPSSAAVGGTEEDRNETEPFLPFTSSLFGCPTWIRNLKCLLYASNSISATMKQPLNTTQALCIWLLPAVASSLDAGRLGVLDEVGPVNAGVDGSSRQLAWSDGLGWVGHREVTWVTYRELAETYTRSSQIFVWI